MSVGVVTPLLNSTYLRNPEKQDGSSIFNEFFFFHDEEKIIQIRTIPNAPTKIIVQNYAGKMLQQMSIKNRGTKLGVCPSGRYLWYTYEA